MNIFRYHHYAFPRLLLFRVQMVLAYQIVAVAVGWHIYELTRDPLSLGLIGLSEVLPYFATALFAGHAVDHYCSKRFFGALAASLLLLNAATLTAIALGWLNNHTTFWIYTAIAVTGVARAFLAPSYNSLFALILPRQDYPRAAGVGASAFQAGLVLGPALGGVLVGFGSKLLAYSVSTALCLGAVLTISSLKIAEPAKNVATPVFASIAQGLRFVFSNQIMLGALSLDMFAVLFGGAVSMLPAFIHDVYHLGPEALGVLRAMPALGAIITGVWLAKHPIHHRTGRWLLLTVAGFGISIIGFGLAQNILFAGIFLLCSGLFDGVSVVLRQTIMQLCTPDEMRGRVASINGIFIGSSNELGAFESGLMARLLGLVPSVIFGGMMTLSVVGAVTRLAPKLRRLELSDLQ